MFQSDKLARQSLISRIKAFILSFEARLSSLLPNMELAILKASKSASFLSRAARCALAFSFSDAISDFKRSFSVFNASKCAKTFTILNSRDSTMESTLRVYNLNSICYKFNIPSQKLQLFLLYFFK